MPKNIPPNLALWDRLLRVAVAVVLLVLWYMGVLAGWLWPILAGALLANALVARCGLYAALGFSTCKLPAAKPAPDKTSR